MQAFVIVLRVKTLVPYSKRKTTQVISSIKFLKVNEGNFSDLISDFQTTHFWNASVVTILEQNQAKSTSLVGFHQNQKKFFLQK